MVRPYKGKGNYVFVSYSHKDSSEVLELISMLQERGYNVWFDEGIDAGVEWGNDIAEHIIGCTCFVAYITGNYLDSQNCCDEINFARDHAGDKLLIFGEETKLPLWMEMRFGRIQAVMRYKYADREPFIRKVETTPAIRACKGDSHSFDAKKRASVHVDITQLPKDQCRGMIGHILDDMLQVLYEIAEVLKTTVGECISRGVYPGNIEELYKHASKESVMKIRNCGSSHAVDYRFFLNDIDLFTDLRWQKSGNEYIYHGREPDEKLFTPNFYSVSNDMVEQCIIDEMRVRRGTLFKLLKAIRINTGFTPEILEQEFKLNNNLYSWIEIYENLEELVE